MEKILGPEVFAHILCLCNAATEDKLPPLWKLLKDLYHRQWVAIISAAYQREKEAMEQNYLTMGATVNKMNMMKTGLWHMLHSDSIKSGFQLF